MVEVSLKTHNELNHANASVASKTHGELTKNECAQLIALALALGGGRFGFGIFRRVGFVGV